MRTAMGNYVGGVDSRGYYKKCVLEGDPNIAVIARGFNTQGTMQVVEAWHVVTGEYWLADHSGVQVRDWVERG